MVFGINFIKERMSESCKQSIFNGDMGRVGWGVSHLDMFEKRANLTRFSLRLWTTFTSLHTCES